MKVCGYCNNEYNDAEPKCPVCGSTLLKHNKHSDPAEAELKRIKDEIERKRKSRSLIIGIGAAVIILAIVIAIFSIVGYVTDPQRDIAKESKELFAQAEQQIDNKNYGAAIDTLDQINPEWDNYADVEALRVEAVRSQLTTKVAEYQAAGNYQGIITFIKENVADINSDPEIKAAYNSAVQQYVSAVLVEADEHLSTANYNSARTVLNTAVALIGDDVNIAAKLAEIENAEILATVAEYENSGDFVSLVSFLQEVAANDANYSALLNQYTQTLIDTTLAKAQSYADNRQFEEAISEIEKVQRTYNCTEFAEAIASFEECLPCSLIDCYAVEKSFSFYSDHLGTWQDSFGKDHANSLLLYGSLTDYVVYNLDSRFATLSGCLVADDTNGGSFIIKVYTDDKLVYESPELKSTTSAVNINIDVSGTNLLRIELVVKSGFSGWCVVDAMLS